MMKYLLLNPLGPEKLPTLKELTTKEICTVWAGTSSYIRRQMLQKQAVDIGIGTFAVVSAHASGGENQVLAVQKPAFQLCRFMKKFYKLKCPKTKIPVKTLAAPLDFEQIAADIHFRQPIVQQCIHETLLFFAGALLDSKEVEFLVKGIGILAVCRKVVSRSFFDDCMLELDATGNMLEALLTDPKMMDIIAFDGKNEFSQVEEDSFITVPRLTLDSSRRASVSLKPKRELQPWGGGARRVSVLDPVLLAKRRVSLARQAEKKGEGANGKQGDRHSFLPAIQKTEEELKQPKPPAQPRPKHSPCAQQPSTTGVRSVRAQIEERQLRLLMASKHKEAEGEVWSQYEAIRRR